jgi:uncharacterized membrane protein
MTQPAADAESTPPAVEPRSASDTSSDTSLAAAGDRGRLGWLRRQGTRWNHAGTVGGLLFLAVSLMPSLLPRTWLVQGLVTGISYAFGYGIGVLVA